MMIPEIINEVEKKLYPDGSYIKQYVVHAPQWAVHLDNNRGAVYSSENYHSPRVEYFVISESTRMGYLETLVFPCDDQGVCTKMIEIMGGRDYTADQVLCSFALMMMEAGYDTV